MSLRRILLALRLGGLLALAALGLGAAEKPAAVAPGDVIYPRVTGARADVVADHGAGYTPVLIAAGLMAAVGGWLFWRGRTAPGGAAALRRLAIAETKSLGNRQFLVVATYEDRKFLLGVCPGRIDLLTPLEGEGKGRP
jgi:flagellar protein FliO/FliZ